MKKKESNKLKKLVLILAIIILSLISFVGIYVMDKGRMKNNIPDYTLGMDLKGNRTVNLKVDTSNQSIVKDSEGKVVENATEEEIAEKGYTKEEVPVNNPESFSQGNYEASKSIIEKRLKNLQFEDYSIKQNKDTGEIFIDLKENTRTDTILGSLTTVGTFEIQDDETKEVLMDNKDIERAKVVYGSTDSGNAVYLSVEFTKEGKKKFEDITSKYNTTTDESGTKVEKKINLEIDGQSIMTTSFEKAIATGILQLSVGSGSTTETDMQKAIVQAKTMAAVLDNGKMPVTYKVEDNKYMQSPVTKENLKIISIGIAVVLVALFLYLVVRYRAKGLLGVIANVGFAGIYLLILRLANVEITTEGIFGIALSLIINYALTIVLLKFLQKEKNDRIAMKDAIVKFLFMMIPIYIIAIVFSFITYSPINSFGMVMFWGITIAFIYNIGVTRNLVMDSTKKGE